ncbi:hypothetical protein BOQ62_02190 [Chryseobacterium sp. CH21]|nr:hypothetical protein BOQ62_02190 [Chryseobacterium sp. CH21]
MKHMVTMVNPYFKMIRFIRLLFYHIYIYYYKKEGKSIAKFTTFLIFTLLFGIILYSGYVLLRVSYSNNIIIHTPYIFYILFFTIIGCCVGSYLYIEDFENLDSFRDYHVKYYLYFFLIAILSIALAFYSASINRERIFKQREMHKTFVEMKK